MATQPWWKWCTWLISFGKELRNTMQSCDREQFSEGAMARMNFASGVEKHSGTRKRGREGAGRSVQLRARVRRLRCASSCMPSAREAVKWGWWRPPTLSRQPGCLLSRLLFMADSSSSPLFFYMNQTTTWSMPKTKVLQLDTLSNIAYMINIKLPLDWEIKVEEQGYMETETLINQHCQIRVWQNVTKLLRWINWWLFIKQTFQPLTPLQSTNFVLPNGNWTNLFMKFILINPPKMNSNTEFHDLGINVCVGFQSWVQFWSSNFNGLNLNSYRTLVTSVKYTFYTSKFNRA
jgi:hypothetical protein